MKNAIELASILERPDEEDLKDEESKPESLENWEKQARRIAAESGDYHQIIERLTKIDLFGQNKNLLEFQIDRVRQEYGEIVDIMDFPTEEKRDKLWEIVTVMELFDVKTARHCLHTYQVAKAKIEKFLFREFSDEENFRLSDLIKNEVDLERFYFACVTHDIGKIAIPLEILNNQTSQIEWEDILKQMTKDKELTEPMLDKIEVSADEAAEADILELIHSKGIKANKLVPLHKVLSPEEVAKIEAKGFSAESSLMDHIEKHESASEQILTSEGFPIVAKIAGRHHNYLHQPKEFPIASDTLYLSNEIATIVHLADMQEALASERSYKEQFTILKALNIIIAEVNRDSEKLTPEIVYLWVKDGYSRLRFSADSESQEDRSEEIKYRQNIENFIKSFQQSSRMQEWLNRHK